jgi:UDP-2,4-diacetamido-2,4,6-trideoxy-beta-L-altropyranose hydrolase
LANGLIHDGHEVLYLINNDETVLTVLDGNGISHKIWLDDDLEYWKNLLKTIEYSTVVIDLYDLKETFLEELSSLVDGVCLFDDENLLSHYPVTWVVNGSPYARSINYPVGDSNVEFLLGCGYLCLREEFLAYRKKEVNKDAILALVIMGGSDPQKQTARCIEACLENYMDVFVSDSAGENVLDTYINNHRVKFFSALENVAAIMNKVDIAISGSGITALELACVGVPTILLELAENQRGNAESLERDAGFSFLGNFSNVNSDQITETVSGLKCDYTKRSLMMMQAQSLIDGNGTKRVAQQLALKAKNS